MASQPGSRREWEPIIDAARIIVNGYSYLITLRQLHYRLVMSGGLGYVNTEGDYKRLSALTAEGRRDGTFPALLDQTREIVKPPSWASPDEYIDPRGFARDHTDGQEHCLVLGGEKATLLAQLEQWFGGTHLPIVLLRGYGSQTYVDDVRGYVEADDRDAILIYAGDLDPSGEDILRDFLTRCPVFDAVEHIAVTPSQIQTHNLPVNPGKATDSRAKGFVDRHGALVQVEVEALPPQDLQTLYQDAIDQYWDESAYAAVTDAEKGDKALLEAIRVALRAGKLSIGPDGRLRKAR